MPSDEIRVRAYWDSHSDVFGDYYKQPTWFDRTFRKAIFLRAMIAVELCREFRGPTVVDIGSGPGINSVAMIKKGGASHLLGIDFAPRMNELARHNARAEGVTAKCEFVEGDFMTHDLPPFSRDIAAALGVFDYVRDPQAFLNRMRDVAKKALVASWPESGLRMALRRARYSCSVYSYTERRIRELHDKAGVSKLVLVQIPAGWVSKAYLE